MPTYETPAGYWHICTRCGHKWPSEDVKPVRCPKCKSPYWNRLRKAEGQK